MEKEKLIQLIKKLFVNRNDVYAEAFLTTPESKKMSYSKQEKLLTDELILAHINHTKTLGVYQLKGKNITWACLDFDQNTLEDFEKFKTLYNKLKEDGKHPLAELSGGGEFKVHIWLFCSTTASDVKYYLDELCENVKLHPHEIFPKQLESNESLPFGNLVKLPLGLHLVTKNTSSILDENFLPLFDEEDIIKRLEYHTNNIDTFPHVKVIVKEVTKYENKECEQDVKEFEEFFNFVLHNELPTGSSKESPNPKIVSVYDNVMKNLAIYLVKRGYSDEQLTNEVKPIYDEHKWNFRDLMGWVGKARKEFDVLNLGELVNWCKIYQPDLLKKLPLKKRPNLNKAIKSFISKEDLAEKFYAIQPVYYDNARIFWLWDFENYKWERVDETDILNSISDVSNYDTVNSTKRNEIIEALKQTGRRNQPIDPQPSWIQFRDKIVDIETGKEFEATHNFFMTNPIPWELGESEETPTIDKLITEWVGEIYKQPLLEAIAYCIYPHMRIHRLFGFVGSGRNGKGTCIRMIEKFVGKDNVASVELDMLTPSNRFGTSVLYKKLVVVIGEIDKGIFEKTSTLKAITGDDSIRVEFKGKDLFDTHNYAKPIVATNHLPETGDKTEGFYSRWVIIKFPNTFTSEKPILETIPDTEYKNLARKSIRILKEVFDRGHFTLEGDIEEKRKKYEEFSNPVTDFIKECCEREFNLKEKLSVFCDGFNRYLSDKRLRPLSNQKISSLLREQGFEIKRETQYEGTNPISSPNFVFGIKLKLEEDEDYGFSQFAN